MHDYDQIRLELEETLSPEGEGNDQEGYDAEDYESPDDEGGPESSYEQDEDGAQGEATGALSEEEEMELASDLLASTSESQLEQAVQRIVRPRVPPPQAGHRPRPRRRRRRRGFFLGKMLKGIARQALPIVGGALGTAVMPGIGTAVGSALAAGAGKAFGLELEGLSAEDQQFEVARSLVRLGAAAAGETDRLPDNVNDATAARVGVIRAAAVHAPGVVPRAGNGAMPSPDPSNPARDGLRNPRERARSGRWVRRGNQIIVLGA